IVGRNAFGWLVETGRVQKIKMLHLISSKNINFLRKGFLACMLSLALLIAGGTPFYIRGDKNFGGDFRGGDLVALSTTQDVSIHQVRETLKPLNLEDALIQQSKKGEKNYPQTPSL